MNKDIFIQEKRERNIVGIVIPFRFGNLSSKFSRVSLSIMRVSEKIYALDVFNLHKYAQSHTKTTVRNFTIIIFSLNSQKPIVDIGKYI